MKNAVRILNYCFILALFTFFACTQTPVQPDQPEEPENPEQPSGPDEPGQPEEPSADLELEGTTVNAHFFPEGVRKVFVLNEGGMGSNNASLDFLRASDGQYISSAFRKMNPQAAATGLGDVGNDIAVHGDELWIVVNNSGIVEVLSAKDEKEIAAIAVPTPRNIAFDDNFAYVTSWAGAFALGSYDENYNYTLVDYKNPKGQVYKIDLNTKEVVGTVEVGYQPEGIAYSNGKLFVANSGGIASQLPPDYAYDNTVSVIDTQTFTIYDTIPVQVNLKSVFADTKGNVYVTSLGNYWNVHSGLFMLKYEDDVIKIYPICEYVSVAAMCGDTLYIIGTESEFDWSAESHQYTAYAVTDNGFDASMSSVYFDLTGIGALYGLAALDDKTFLVADAGDYFNPGQIRCYYLDMLQWTVDAGVCPGHFAIW